MSVLNVLNVSNKRKCVEMTTNPNNDDLIRFTNQSPNKKSKFVIFSPEFKLPPPTREKKNSSTHCTNPTCNHKTLKEDPTEIQVPLLTEITNIDDLIALGKSYHCKKNTMYCGMNLRILCQLVPPLNELSQMVGMQSVKHHMVDQILFFLQGFNVTTKCGKCTECNFNLQCVAGNNEMLHTIITGSPGVGKTELGKILGKVYKELGILSTGTFKLVTRADLVAGYLGQTAVKTQKVIDEARGGVLFIDEAYSLGNSEQRDSFSKECIDTLNQNLSERRDFLCIIAGYKDALDKCFFSYNEGLKRRFTFKYEIEGYKGLELLEIFERKINAMDWSVEWTDCTNVSTDILMDKQKQKDEIKTLFLKNTKLMPNYGGDVETLLLNCKIAHSRRCTMKTSANTRCLSVDDVKSGFDLFISHRKSGKNVASDGLY
jgi:hypothetical protein